MYNYVGCQPNQPLYFQLVEMGGRVINQAERINQSMTVNIRTIEVSISLERNFH